MSRNMRTDLWRFGSRPTCIEDLDADLLNCWVAHPECTTDQLRAALDQGFDCNTRWEKAVIEDGDYHLKESSRFSWAMAWRHVNTPLHRFSMANKLDAVLVLLEYGAQMEILNAMGRTALHEAVDWDRSGVVKLLIENGADTNSVSGPQSEEVDEAVRWWYAGRVPLYEAIYNSNLEIVKMLIRAGSNYKLVSSGGWSILDLALLQRDRSIISLLFQHGAKASQHDYNEAESPTLQDSARLLLAHVARFPSDDCKKAYSHVVSRPEFVAAYDHFSTSQHPLDVFLSLLSRAAQMPNPEDVPGALYCTRCTGFVQHVSSNDKRQTEIHPNRLSLTRSSEEGCSLCALFDEALQLGAGSGTAVQSQGGDDARRPVFVSATIGRHDRHMTVFWGEQKQKLRLYPMSECFIMDHQRIPDDEHIGTGSPRAFELARAWLKNCEHNHPCCKRGIDRDADLPTRVINVGDTSNQPFLHDSNGERGSYVALSYCWGRSGTFRTTKVSVLEHSKKLPLDMLPATLRDAITVTRELGIRYLWIDAVCIVQDDIEDWNREAAMMQSTYANATITLSALASDDANGGLFYPRKAPVVSPAPLSLHLPPKDRPSWGQRPPKLYWFLLPAQASMKPFQPGAVHSRAWTLQEQHLSSRIIHFGLGLMYWECLSCHGSELDPEGQNWAYGGSREGSFNYLRKQKRLVQGYPSTRDLEIYGSDTYSEEARALAMRDRLPGYLYQQWQDLVSEYSARALTKQSDKVSAFLGLSRTLEDRLQDEFIAGVWRKEHFLPSLLWNAVESEIASRNPGFPSWTWASIVGKVQYRHKSFQDICWEPSEVSMDVVTSGPSQNHVTGSIRLRSTLRKFPSHFCFGMYSDTDPMRRFWRTMVPRNNNTKERVIKSLAKDSLQEQEEDRTLVEHGFRDVRSSPQETEESLKAWEGAGAGIYCVVLARTPKGPPLRTGPGAPCYAGHPFPNGKPATLTCLCLTKVEGEKAAARSPEVVFRRIGLCEFWDAPSFWEGAVKDEWVTII